MARRLISRAMSELALSSGAPASTHEDPRWAAVATRDAAADGRFVFAVKTTGVYCRPSCPSRQPRRENVVFYRVPEAAEAAGYRACKRCRPKDARASDPALRKVRRVCARIDEALLAGESGPPALAPRGRLRGAATSRGLAAGSIGDDDARLERALHAEYPAAEISRGDARLRPWITAILEHIAGERPNLALPLDLQATAFQWKVWRALRKIPYGSTATYGEIAREIGRPKAVRAVANACASNRAALVIPCHRAVRADGDIGGYRWGAERKEKILAKERAAAKERQAG